MGLVLAASAATQGTLGSTSTGSYANNFGVATPRQVQILQLVDAFVTSSSPLVPEAGGVQRKGVIDSFCVVDTTGGAVHLAFSGLQSSPFWVATAADGQTFPYLLNVSLIDGPWARLEFAGISFDVPAGRTVTSAAACGIGNVRKMATLGDAPLDEVHVYESVITIVASPI
ncbi:hypothetical protein GT347_04170 [Xylophilus rhododendri]|uniref:Uncharacterized protein n=1 Tax=Xylophilus rhododendri TaxID=2697032 RepID=A0A857J055_9BURK|nr:hypothetical protein [Xylophilus rhododendri]QHI97244.1 hypothetical protein GT347_04170 [Xylophilus rhododendri]